MKRLSITVDFTEGIEMENNLNKAISDLSTALETKGLIDMNLSCLHVENLSAMYKVEILTIENPNVQECDATGASSE